MQSLWPSGRGILFSLLHNVLVLCYSRVQQESSVLKSLFGTVSMEMRRHDNPVSIFLYW